MEKNEILNKSFQVILSNNWIRKVIIIKLYIVLKMMNIEYSLEFVINFV